MHNRNRRAGALALAAFAAAAVAPAIAAADEVFAVTSDDVLVRFDTALPGTITSTKPITGMTGHVLAVDVRPQNGELFVVTDANRLYRLDPTTGAAVQVGTGPFTPGVVGTDVGADFSPTADSLRVVSDMGGNFRLDPSTGKVIDADASTGGTQLDTVLLFAPGDVHFGTAPHVVGLAYTNSTAGATQTTAYGIDSGLDALVRLGDVNGDESTRNSGLLHTVGPIGFDTTGSVAFDVSRTTPGVAYASLTLTGETTSKLYVINLTTGAATLVGPVGDARTIRAISIGPVTPIPPATTSVGLVGLTANGELVKFSTAATTTITSRTPITGLLASETLVAIDTRTQTRKLYAVSNTGHLYVIDVSTGAAAVVRQDALEVPLVGTSFGFDVNPESGELRLVSDTGLNLRIDASTGAVIDADAVTVGIQADTALVYDVSDVNAAQTAHVVAIAYDRNDAANQTTLFGIDANTDTLVRIGSSAGTPESANTGKIHTIGSLGVNTTDVASFEIANNDTALAALTDVSGTTSLYSIDLTTGAATLIGPVGTGQLLVGLTVAPTTAGTGNFAITRVNMKFDFRRTGRDSVTVMGNLPVTSGPLKDRTVTIDVGGLQKTFVLNRLGARRDGNGTRTALDDDTFARVGRTKNGVMRFKATFRREDLQAVLADEGFVVTEDLEHVSRSVIVTVTIDGTAYLATVNMDFTAHLGRRGIAHSVGVATQD